MFLYSTITNIQLSRLESAAGMLYSVGSRFSMVNAELIRDAVLCGAEPQMAADTYSSESP